ncbi:hypothetical protein [Brevibacillus reuszeri]|uniref:hypothetical protein n=1 Tax=Brevibacillus reuszeri TaxID=54915 RepID=UPI000CCC7A60|nr:hypothetical protein [Brevibacillus reuszeri]
MSSKAYNAIHSEWPTEIGIVDRAEITAKGPAISTDGNGAPIDALQMMAPGVYAVPPMGATVEFLQTEEGPRAGLMVDWPEEQEALEMLAKKARNLPGYSPGDLILFASGALLREGYVQYLHFKADGSVKWMTINVDEPDSKKQVITDMTSDKNGVRIKTKSWYVEAETLTHNETGGA